MASERVQRRIDRLLDQVEEAIDQLDWETVLARSQAVLALDPDNADAVNFWLVLNGHLAVRPVQRIAIPNLPLGQQAHLLN